MYAQEYVAPTLTVDGVIFQLAQNRLQVLLIQRSQDPFAGAYALPGGYNPAGETTQQALARIIQTKAGVDVQTMGLLEQLYTFDTVARDPRGHAVSITYMGLCREVTPAITKDTQNPQFFDLAELPELAYDHGDIIRYALERLQSKITYTNAVYGLLPPLFTLSELQAAYEAVLERLLDKRNFRKKFLSLDLIESTDEFRQDGAHRPARLHRFKQSSLQTLTRSFD